MLTALNIQHFVLIDHLSLTFDKGLSVFTGETGAGKSILLDALSLLLGGRSEGRFVSKGADQTVVSATFKVKKSHPVLKILDELGLMCEEDLVLRRTLNKDGKSKAFVCDQPVSIATLKTIGETLVEIHGQFATHGLLNPATHLKTLDAYGHLSEQVKLVSKAWAQWQDKEKVLSDFEGRLAQQQSDETFLRESLDELDKLNPKENEEEVLVKKRTELMNAEHIIENVKNAYQFFDEEEQGILRLLSKADNQLATANKITNGAFDKEIESLAEAQTILSDLSDTLEYRLNDLGDTSELSVIDDRLFALRDLARKHHIEIKDLPQLRTDLTQQLAGITHGEERLAALKKEVLVARETFLSEAQSLSQGRQRAAQELTLAVMKELPELKLEKATFKVAVNSVPPCVNGIDQVVFLVATNKGADFTPIHKCASGGELSRFMLALKVNLAQENQNTLIFDEIDTGISGATASAVGERLARLGEKHQTLVITHSPQVAGFGKHHYLVQKADTETTTHTSVRLLDKTERLEEMARLLSGAKITDKSRQLAKELMR